MKKLFITGILALLVTSVFTQVTLERSYNFSASVVKLETLGYKYYLMDVPTGQCRIYNTDHSLFKTVNCNIPGGFYLSDIKYISEKLFDTDTGIELLCTYYKYNSSKDYYEYDSKIINEDGSQITFIDGALYNFVNKTGENTYKLFSYCYDFSVSPESVWTNIYNVPGTVVSASYLGEKVPEILLNAFPNPATHAIKVNYELPDNVKQATLHLIDNTGRQINQFIIDNHTDFLMLDVSGFKSGVYHYYIGYANSKTGSKKLVVK